MNKHDQQRWARCASLADIGEVMCAWLAGEVSETPDYHGGPHGETRRHMSVMCGLNRHGFITNATNDEGYFIPNAHVAGFIRPGRVPRLYVTARRYGVEVAEMPRRVRRDSVAAYVGYVQEAAADELDGCRMVMVQDPVEYRFARRSPLWPALREFARRGA